MPLRITRTRPAKEGALAAPPAPVGRVTRVRGGTIKVPPSGKPRYVIDWTKPLGSKLQLYLMSSFLYYQLNRSVITDHEYDRLCDELAAGWLGLKHQHKRLVDLGSLMAGTGYDIKYTNMIMCAANMMLRNFEEV